jgi:histidine ammonia-lyase
VISSTDSLNLVLDGQRTLTPDDLEAAGQPLRLTLSEDARTAVARCADFVRIHRASGKAIYGLSTGFGPLVTHAASSDPETHGIGLLNHLRAGQGEVLAPRVARAMLLARAWTLGKGYSGVSAEVLDVLAASLGTSFAPAVPEWGSVGASGDLAPLAHAAGTLCGGPRKNNPGFRGGACGGSLCLASAKRGRDVPGRPLKACSWLGG